MIMITIMGTGTLQSLIPVDQAGSSVSLVSNCVLATLAAYIGAWVCALGTEYSTARSRIFYLLVLELLLGLLSNINADSDTPLWYKTALLAATLLGNWLVIWHFSTKKSD